MSDCAICHEAMTATTGRTVLGCTHEFHLACITRWFHTQEEGKTSCPCCRRVTGELDSPHREAPKEPEAELELIDTHLDTIESIMAVLLSAQALSSLDATRTPSRPLTSFGSVL